MISTIIETSWHHEGDFLFYKEMVCLLVQETKTDYIKFHLTFDPQEYAQTGSHLESAIQKWSFNETQWGEIIRIGRRNDKKLVLLVNDKKSVDFALSFQPEIIEAHSVCMSDIHLLNHISQKTPADTRIALGASGCSPEEIKRAIEILRDKKVILMFGFQNYPTSYENINLNKFRKIMELFPGLEYGYADHTAHDDPNNLLVSIIGASIGVHYLEKHVSITPGVKRTDFDSAVSIELFNEIADKIKLLNACLGDGNVNMNDAEKKYCVPGSMKKIAFAAENLRAGEKIQYNQLVFHRTDTPAGIGPDELAIFMNSPLKSDVSAGTILQSNHF